MKKLIKVTALLLVAAAMFAGCKNNDDDSSIGGALFSKEDVSVDITYNEITFQQAAGQQVIQRMVKILMDQQ